MYFYIFQRLIHIFKDDFTKFQDKRHFFQIRGVFQDQGKNFPGLCEFCKSMSHIILTPKFTLWLYVVVMEFAHCFHPLAVPLISGVSS